MAMTGWVVPLAVNVSIQPLPSLYRMASVTTGSAGGPNPVIAVRVP
jgi:hypothetical protein